MAKPSDSDHAQSTCIFYFRLKKSLTNWNQRIIYYKCFYTVLLHAKMFCMRRLPDLTITKMIIESLKWTTCFTADFLGEVGII